MSSHSNVTPTSPTHSTDTEEGLSDSTTHTLLQGRHKTYSEQSAPRLFTMPELDLDRPTFGTPVQKFSKEMVNALSKYKVSEDLTDSNYPTWSQ